MPLLPDRTQTVLTMSLPSEWQCAHLSLSVLFTSLTTHVKRPPTPLLRVSPHFFVNDSAFSRPGPMKHRRRLLSPPNNRLIGANANFPKDRGNCHSFPFSLTKCWPAQTTATQQKTRSHNQVPLWPLFCIKLLQRHPSIPTQVF